MARRLRTQDLVPIWAGTRADPDAIGRRVDAWLGSGDRLAILAIGLASAMWLAYGLVAAIVFGSPDESVPARFSWQLPTALTIGAAAGIAITTPSPRGLVLVAALLAGSALGLLSGVLLAGGFPSAADDASYVGFVLLLAGLLAAGWAAGASTRWLLLRRTGAAAVRGSRTRLFVVSAILGVLVASFGLGVASDEAANHSQWAGDAPQPTAGGQIGVTAVWWDAPAHAFLPRFGARTVALGVRYAAEDGAVPVSHRRWQAHDQDLTTYRAIVWPNRRPLRRIGQPLTDAILQPPRATRGWIGFVVPSSAEWLDVSVETEAGSLAWRVDTEGGARVAP